MNPRTILWLVGVVLIAVSLGQLPSLAVALALGESWQPFAVCAPIGAGLGLLLTSQIRDHERALNNRSAFVAVTTCWVAACVLGAAPLIGLGLPPLDALFESSSGFTTTGATVLSGLDQLPRSLLLWRAMSQWLGGMGAILVGVAVLPVLGVGGMQLYRDAAPGPTKDKLTPRIVEAARILAVLYVGLTAIDTLALYLGGMTPFDAICHAMSTLSTGGFSTHDASFGAFDSPFIHLVTTLFMLLGGMSFTILHRFLTRRVSWRTSPELRTYVGIFALVSAVIATDLWFEMPEQYGNWAQALEHALFQTAAILTTTGFSSQDQHAFPELAVALMLGLVFIGGMASSSAGGIKVFRVLLLVQQSLAQFAQIVHPRSVTAVRLGDRRVDDGIILSVLGFLGIWLLSLVAGTSLLAVLGFDIFTALRTAALTLANVGPSLGEVGAARAYAEFSGPTKLVLVVLMLLGRVEIYTALVILTPRFWRR